MKPLNAETVAALAAGSPDTAVEARNHAFKLYQELPMPSSRQEVWRYVDLDFDLVDFELTATPGEALAGLPATVTDAAGSIQIIDGHLVRMEAQGVEVSAGPRDFVAGLAPDLDKFSAAARAFGPDPVLVTAPPGSAVGPVVVDVQAVTPGVLAASRLLLAVEPQAELSVIVVYRSGPGEIVAIPQIEAEVGDGGRLKLTTYQDWGDGTRAVAQQYTRVGRDATFHHGEIGVGAALGRLHFFVDLAGPGGHAEIAGLYFGEQEQLLDYRAFVTHRAPHTTSNMFLKGAVEDASHSVFTGLIRIEEEAQKVDAYQTNRNLVLSDEAGAESVPNLEILANDVRCGHGSTVGPLDREQRYYLMSRGIDRIHADRLQVRGFFEEAIEQLPHPEVSANVREAVNAKYVRAQEEGRV